MPDHLYRHYYPKTINHKAICIGVERYRGFWWGFDPRSPNSYGKCRGEWRGAQLIPSCRRVGLVRDYLTTCKIFKFKNVTTVAYFRQIRAEVHRQNRQTRKRK